MLNRTAILYVIQVLILLDSNHVFVPSKSFLVLCLAAVGAIRCKGTNGSRECGLPSAKCINTVNVYKWNIMKADKVYLITNTPDTWLLNRSRDLSFEFSA